MSRNIRNHSLGNRAPVTATHRQEPNGIAVFLCVKVYPSSEDNASE